MATERFTDPMLLTGLVGFLIVAILMFYGNLNHTWGVTLALFFVILFISSLLSISPELPAALKKRQKK